MDPQLSPLFEATTSLFAGAGRYAWHFARGKLRHDPVFFALLMCGLFPDRGRLLDLGCGQGILLALLVAAKEQFQRGHWPQSWPPPPLNLGMRGIEMRKDQVEAARLALGSRAQVDRFDIRDVELQPCSVIALLDVLHYLNWVEQDRLLEKAANALDPGGLLLLREADASAGLAFRITRWCERLAGAGRGLLWQELCYRGASRWIATLQGLGFSVRAEPMSRGTPFANVLFVARRPSVCSP